LIGYLLRRLAVAVPTTVVAVLIVFVAIRVLPNNPILASYGQHAVPEDVEEEMEKRGWDQPLYQQLGTFIADLVSSGDLGESFFGPETVAEGLWEKFPATVELALAALFIAIPCGLLLGIAAAVWHNRWPDSLCTAGSLLGLSIPVFFLGSCLLYLFPNMPTDQRLPVITEFDHWSGFILIESLLQGRLDVFGLALKHLCLPAIALSTIPMAIIARITRSSMLEILSADYIRTAKAKGNAPWRVVMRHAFPNASIPVVNIAGLQLGALLSGAVLTESVFNWPGLGTYLVEAVIRSDYEVVQGATMLVALIFVMTNLMVDMLYVWLDPRVRLGEAAEG